MQCPVSVASVVRMASPLLLLVIGLTSVIEGVDPAIAAGLGGSATPTTGATISMAQTVDGYRLVLAVGPREEMYTREQVARQHPTSGEVMIAGQMAMSGDNGMTGMSTPTPGRPEKSDGTIHHVELHVYDAKTHQPVTDAKVTIEIVDDSAPGKSISVPIATMEGVREGSSDLPYGNNVALPSSRGYIVRVTVNSQRATFVFHLGGAEHGGVSSMQAPRHPLG